MTSRWAALVIIFASFLQFTLNWFAVVPIFPDLALDMGLSPMQIGGVASAFVAGYGITHIPAGIIAERCGMHFALLLGMSLEGFGTAATASVHNYEFLILARFVCGIRGAVYVGTAIGLVAAWFRKYELAMANGLITGVAFALGAAIGLLGWGKLAALLGWRAAILSGAVVSLISILLILFAYPHPPEHDIGKKEPSHSVVSFRRSFINKRLWFMSLAYIGGYGSYLTAVVLIPDYAVNTLHLPQEKGDELGTILLLSGIIGSFLAGWLADRVLGLLRTFLCASVVEALALAMIPYVSPACLPWVTATIGAMVVLAFVSWISLPGMMQESFRTSDVPTAAGFMLTIAALGGVALPPLYAELNIAVGPHEGWLGLAATTIIFSFIALLDWSALRQLRQASLSNSPL